MLTTPKSHAELSAAVLSLKRRLAAMQWAPAETISERIAKSEICCQIRAELARLEQHARMAATEQRKSGHGSSNRKTR